MKRSCAVLSCLCFVLAVAGLAQQKKTATPPKPKTALAAALEAKVRQAWADYQLKKKATFAATLTDDFVAVAEDGAGPRDKKSEVDGIDQSDLAQYALSDFKVKSLGADTVLVMYTAEYSGASAGQPIRDKVLVTEIWTRRSGAWKCLHEQMTRMS